MLLTHFKLGSRALARIAMLLLIILMLTAPMPAQETTDPLPSWNNGPARQAVLDFVRRVTTEGSADYVPPADRMATFDNDGTLWCEQPVVQLAFASVRLKQMLPSHPEWNQRPAIQAALKGDVAYFEREGEQALAEVVAITHTGITVEQFQQAAAEFFRTGKHPKYGVLYKDLAYLPMVELLAYLREHGFKTWICSGGGAEFMRAISHEIYGIPPEQVIGSMGGLELQERDGRAVLVKMPKLLLNNDKANKPVGIALQIGRIPILASGNVRTGGDIAMLRFSQSNPRLSLQLLVNHDDAEREFAYAEKDNASLNAAKKHGWTVVSVQRDWKRVFAFQR